MSFFERLRRGELPRRVLGAVLSVMVPGAGHVVLGHSTLGWVVAGVTLAIGAGVILSALAVATTLFLLLGSLLILITIGSVVSVFALPPGPRLKDGLRALWPVLVLFLVFRGAASLVSNFGISVYQMPSSSMLPLVADHDVLFADLGKQPVTVGDVVVFEEPGHADVRSIKRIVAVGGQRVRFDGGRLFIDDVAVPQAADGEVTVRQEAVGERPAYEQKYERVAEQLGGRRFPTLVDRAITVADPAPITLAADQVYVLGDNRTNSHDSRHFGPVPRSALVAKALFVFAASGKELQGSGRIWQRLWSPAP